MRPADLLDVLHETPRRVEAMLRGMPRALIVWTPAPGKWSILEVLRHLRDMERAATVAAARSGASTQTSGAAARLDREAPPSEVVREWKRLRRELLEPLRRGGESAWQAEVEHPTAGILTMEKLALHQADHDLQHLKQIEAILERHAILGRLAAMPRDIRALVEGLPRETLRRAAGPTVASLLDEIAAMCHFEAQMQARYAQILELDRPPLPPLDAEPAPPRWQDPNVDPFAALRELERLRGLTHEILHALGPRVWQRKGVHPRRGELSIAELVTQHRDRDTEFLARLRAIRAAVLAPPAAAVARGDGGDAPVASGDAPVASGDAPVKSA